MWTFRLELDQLVLADLLTSSYDEQVQDVQRSASQLYGAVLPDENMPAWNQPERPERKGHSFSCAG